MFMVLLIEEPSAVKNEVFDHFKKIFSEPNMDRPRFVSDKFKTISSDQAMALECGFSEKEIQLAFWSCEGSKAPGPDGFSINFVKKNWDFLGHHCLSENWSDSQRLQLCLYNTNSKDKGSATSC